MNCLEWEREIASEQKSSELQEHLQVCANCREFASELEANRATLRACVVDPAACITVRRGVLSEIRSGEQRSRWWTWAGAAAACVALLCVSLARLHPESPGPPRAIEFAKQPRLVEPGAPKSVRPHRRQVALVAHKEPLVVKMLTTDPDIIIIWLVDQKGDSL